MSTVVIMPGGFHPFHAGHMSLYNSARKAFPDAELFVAATDSREERPFPFAIKEKLAKVAGVEPGHFIQVKSPFQAKEITQNYNPEQDVLIFVRSEKDRNESPKPGGMKKDGTPAYFQPYDAEKLQPFGKHAYFAYLPTVKFGPGITSATEIRKAWPTLDDRRKTAMVMSLYPATQKNPKLAQNVVQLLDMGMGGQLNEFAPGNGDDGLPYAEYVVYQCDPKDQFEFIGGPLYQTDSLGMAHKYAYEMFLKHRPKAFVVYQPHKEASRGNYGVKGESDEQGVAEGEVIPFARKPQPKLTWQQVPKDVLLLANDWFWADEDDMGLDAVLDPKGYGSGTSNDLKYITAKLQQKGWTIEHDLDDNRPGQFNMKLTNNRGQSVLLPWEDAQDFKGWAAGTRPSMSEGDENQYRRPSSGEVARVSQQTQAKLNPVRSQFVWKKPNQIGGSFSEQDLLAKGFKKSQYNSWGGTQQMWDRLSGVKEARVLFTNPNTKVNVYYNSRNPKYLGKPVQVGKEIPYNKIDKFIDMIVSKYQVKPTEFMWTDSSRDRTDAHIVHEIKDYLEEK